jgi:hypothetical protein
MYAALWFAFVTIPPAKVTAGQIKPANIKAIRTFFIELFLWVIKIWVLVFGKKELNV